MYDDYLDCQLIGNQGNVYVCHLTEMIKWD